MQDEQPNLGRRIDQLYKLRQRIRAAEEKVNLLKAEAKTEEDELLRAFGDATLDGAKGKQATATVTRLTVASIEDFDAFTAYVGRNKAYDLFQRRVSVEALRARLDAKKVVPGVKTDVIKHVRLSGRKQ